MEMKQESSDSMGRTMIDEIGQETRKVLGELAADMVRHIGKISKDSFDKLVFELNNGFVEYADLIKNKCTYTKTLINRSKPIRLLEIYEGARFSIGSEANIEETIIIERALKGDRFVIQGGAGTGKSMFMKSCCLQIIRKGDFGFPIFLEFRKIFEGEYKTRSLIDCVYDEVSSVSPGFTRTQFNYGLSQGAFELLLDGFDEIPLKFQDVFQTEILDLSFRYPQVSIVVSARPNARYDAWTEFSIVRILPLELDGALSIVEKIDYDLEKKRAFSEQLSREIFEKYREVASNPLLLTMMLLVFDKIGDIPSKQYKLFEKAFEVLTIEHDSLKMYKRRLYSVNDVNDLRDIFSAFSALTYLEQKLVFSSRALLEYLKNAVDLSQISVEGGIERISYDLIESISI
jgi:predicted NACHT family NTPase